MKGKIGFVLGAALGYVLGSRAGRERYEQIKRGASAVWETPLVQQGVSAVKHQIGDGLDSVKAAAANVAKAAFDAATQPRGAATQPRGARASDSGAKHEGSAPGDTKPDGAEETLV
ncbi:YtxH domain-containing protein [Leucobacter denitrificans]|uniref:YtxH domain-containing protein n=1 Tax=Leucobacter denitrificans TaxID=683042 RepID=A0A7G9S251_9MICO|nr:YtxH domain-containing protein [Leucobacter denitrificans]QNN61926.1 YtxH domain-containing protein [Leucobacter denitrificans]